MKGYKIFNADFTCRGYQFSENTEYKHKGEFSICNSGFHFCEKLTDCFSYYQFDHKNIVCEVEALGEIQKHGNDTKIATNHIKIGKKLTWEEVLFAANEGQFNTGHSNTGDSNTGDSNTGGWNTGDSNTGYSNTGDRNTGYRNTGYRNTGDSNTGGWNTGDSNTGDSNTGYRNTGYRNTGDSNTGGWNTGDSNTGYSNTGDRNTGAFCTGEKYMKFFNKDSNWTEEMFKNSRAYNLLCYVDTKMWIYTENMTSEEKEKFPSHKTTGGYLKDIPFKEAFQNKWHNWSEENQNEFKKLPNFDAGIFEEITGVKVK
jgi:hypothetical protein